MTCTKLPLGMYDAINGSGGHPSSGPFVMADTFLMAQYGSAKWNRMKLMFWSDLGKAAYVT